MAAFLAVALGAVSRAEQMSPREIWPQAANAARDGDLDGATKRTTELMDTGKAFGLKRYPVYASAAAGFARQSMAESKPDIAGWADKTATLLDPKSPAVSTTLLTFSTHMA